MTDRAEAPERLSDQLIELWASRPELQVGVPYRSMATEAARLAAQERDAAVAAALEEAKTAACNVLDDCTHPDCEANCDEGDGYSLCAGGHLARSVVKEIAALPRNADALRKHEAKLLREMAEKLAAAYLDRENVNGPVAWLYDEAARREGA